jgi:hypothetical protein
MTTPYQKSKKGLTLSLDLSSLEEATQKAVESMARLAQLALPDPITYYRDEYFLHQHHGKHYLTIPARQMDTERLLYWLRFNYEVRIDRRETNVCR